MTVVSPGHDSNYAAKLECDDQTSANYETASSGGISTVKKPQDLRLPLLGKIA